MNSGPGRARQDGHRGLARSPTIDAHAAKANNRYSTTV